MPIHALLRRLILLISSISTMTIIHGCYLKNNPFLKMSPDAGARQQPLLPAQTPPPKAAPGTTGGREGRVRAPALGKPSAGWVVVVYTLSL